MTGIEPAYSAWEVRLEGPAPFLRGSAYAPRCLTLFAALDRLALFASAPTSSALTFVPPRTSPQDDFVARYKPSLVQAKAPAGESGQKP